MPSCIPGIGSNDPSHYLHFPWSCKLLNSGGARRLQQEVERDIEYNAVGPLVGFGIGLMVSASLLSLIAYGKLKHNVAPMGSFKIHPQPDGSDDLWQ